MTHLRSLRAKSVEKGCAGVEKVNYGNEMYAKNALYVYAYYLCKSPIDILIFLRFLRVEAEVISGRDKGDKRCAVDDAAKKKWS